MARQKFSDFIGEYYLCRSCGIVDTDHERIRKGHECSRCGVPGDGALGYFKFTVGTTADLIGELHPLPDLYSIEPESEVAVAAESHNLALLVFFCTLGEILLQHFLQRCMSDQKIPIKVQDRLLGDNLFVKQRIDKLFPMLIGEKWTKAIKNITEKSREDFVKVVEFYVDANEKRNQLLHLGNKWAVSAEFDTQCFDNTAPLVKLFVALHNEYLAKPID
jgi:hypothetical protein